VTGNVVVSFNVMIPSSAPDLFVYLEEVDSTGAGHMVTEGQLDLRHGALATGPRWLPRPGAYHSFLSHDMVAPGHGIEAAVELLPVSHRFAKGNRIRLVLARADRDHFAVFAGPQPEITMTNIRVRIPVELPPTD
jgi:predicted acyl esterase